MAEIVKLFKEAVFKKKDKKDEGDNIHADSFVFRLFNKYSVSLSFCVR